MLLFRFLFGFGLEFGEDEADAAYDVVGWGLVRGEGKELDGEMAGVGAEDEAAFVEVDVAEQEGGTAADGVERGLVGAVGGEGVVVAVEDADGSGAEERVHGGGLLGVSTDGEEALPVGVFGGGAGAVVVEARGGDLEGFDNRARGDASVVHSDGGGDDGYNFCGITDGLRGGRRGGGQIDGEKLFYSNILRGEDAVQTFEREGAFAIKEVGNVRLLEAGLLGETAAGEGTALDAAEKFETEEFVEVLEGHRVRDD